MCRSTYLLRQRRSLVVLECRRQTIHTELTQGARLQSETVMFSKKLTSLTISVQWTQKRSREKRLWYC